MNDTDTRLMALADKAIAAQDQRLGHLAQDHLQALQEEPHNTVSAIEDLRKALAAPQPAQQAPVVWMPRTWAERYVSGVGAVTCSLSQMAGWVPLYTATPPAEVPLLTDAEILAIMRSGNNCNYNDEGEHIDFARAIEQIIRKKAGIK